MTERDPDEFTSRQWPDWSKFPDGKFDRRMSGRFGRHFGRVFGIVFSWLWMLFLLEPINAILTGGYPALSRDVLLGTFALYIVCYPLSLWFGPEQGHIGRVGMVAGMFAIGLVPALVLRDPVYLSDLAFALVTALFVLPLRYSRLLGVATIVAEMSWMWLGTGRVDWNSIWGLLIITLVMTGFFGIMFTVGQLRAAREQVRTLAVAEERERVARDLHDILGHSLSTMTVKMGLTRRILEAGGEREEAIAEIRELEGLSRQALSDVRATVSDYRTVTLSAEIAGAHAALQAAGVAAELPGAVDDVAPELQGVFGYVVREAVTNVLRHSNAERCRIRLGRDWLEITDDGTAPPYGATGGHGLPGLAERLAAVSGTLEHSAHAGGGFRVLARGPARAAGPEPARARRPASRSA